MKSDDRPVHEILKAMPSAQREGAIRNASTEIIELLHTVFVSVGFPKTDGRWSPYMAHCLEDIRQKVSNPPSIRPEP